jgi:predicted nucleic acid-binding protein
MGVKLAFDADVLIYAAQANHPVGPDILCLLEAPELDGARFGSVLLLPELLSKPSRLGLQAELDALTVILATLELQDMDLRVAALAVQFGATYKLKAPDAIHLASAVTVGADVFITNNARDFDANAIIEVQVLFPADLGALALV